MRQNLNSRVCDIINSRNTELCTDVVFASRGLVASQNSVGEVSALLGKVLDERCGFEICLWDRDVKDSRPRGDINRNRHVHTLFGCCRGGQQRQ